MNSRPFMIWTLLLLSYLSFGQDCLKKLEDARRAYYDGQLLRVIELLEACSADKTLDDRDREEAMKLIINAALVLGQDDVADRNMLSMLSLNPLAQVKSTDLMAYQKLFNSYKVRKKQNVGLLLGVNKASFQTMQYRSLGSITEEGAGYDSRVGITVGLDYDRYLTEHIFLSTGATYNTYSYQQDELILTYQRSFIEERLDFLTIPLQVGLEASVKEWDFFIAGGMNGKFLLSARGDLELFGIQGPDPVTIIPGIPEKQNDADLRFQRKSMVFNAVFNVGFRKRFGLIGLEMLVQYDYGLNNLVEESGRFENEQIWRRFSYVPDDFRMNALTLMVGVSRRFYQPKRKEQ